MFYQTSADLRTIVPPALLATGCVNVVGLDAMKNYMGAQWPQLRDSVHARLEAMFRARLGPTDFFIKLDDAAYLVAMPSNDPEDVDTACLRISYDLYTSCMGRCDLGHIQVSNASVGDGDGLNLDLLPFERIIELAGAAGIQSFNTPGNTPNGLNEPRAPDGETAAAPPPASATPLPTESGRTVYVEHQFVPVWSATNAAVTTYICSVRAILAGPRREPIPPVLLTPKERLKSEVACLHAGVAQLAKSVDTPQRFLLGVAISFEILGSPTGRMEFLSACRDLSGDYRQYIDFTLLDVPPGVAQTRLAGMVNMLRPFSRSVSATVAPRTRVFSAYQGIGLRAIGFNLREFAGGRALRLADVELLARNARYAGLGTFLLSVPDRSALEAARAAGIQQLSGNAVAAPCDEPRGMWRLTWTDVTAQQQPLAS